MCGFSGFIDFKKSSNQKNLIDMIQTLHHRGPDNNTAIIFDEPSAQIGLAHARLSIIDLSEKANQPMNYNNFNIVFNGEIYNFKEIVSELTTLGHHFNLHSDTEMILHAYEQWGEKCVEKFIGMFSIVLYDKNLQKIIFIRDRAGVKPLYYYFKDNLFLFGSELKAVISHPKFEKSINSQAVSEYFKYAYIPVPLTIYDDIFKLPSASIGTLNLVSKAFEIQNYWDINSVYSKLKLKNITFEDAKAEVHNLLESAVNYRKIADVPLGVFLSGGFDSSLVTAILQKNNSSPIKTFTIGFESGNNEAPFAKTISNYLKTEHHEFYCTQSEGESLIKKIPFHYDEPFADSSAIPTMFVSEMASKQVKVVLSADGGDEVFCGYNTYSQLENYNNILYKTRFVNGKLLSLITQLIAFFLPTTSFKKRKFNSLALIFKTPKQFRQSILFEEFQTLSNSILDKLLLKKTAFNSVFKTDVSNFQDATSMAMAIDYKNYLQNDILTKVDRATMAFSIEGREPLLDHRLIEFAAQLPTEFKFKNGVKKYILKEILYDYIPKELMDRPKLGFSVPIYDWLKGDLRYLLDEYLNRDSILKSNIFNVDFTLKIVEDFKNNKLPDETLIWKLLMFQMWHKQWIQN